MYDLGVCEFCGYKIADFILWRGISFCNTDCLVEWVENGHKSRPTTGAVDVAYCDCDNSDVSEFDGSCELCGLRKSPRH